MYINGQTELIISFFCENNSESLSIKTIHKILDQQKKKKSNITTLLSPIPIYIFPIIINIKLRGKLQTSK